MDMFRRVLFPTDLSSYADAVLACLPELHSAGTREIVVLYVVRPYDVPLGHTKDQDILETVKWGVNQRLHVIQLALEREGFNVRTRLEEGLPAEEIVRVASEERVGVIVMGAQGVSPAQELMLGSTAFEVVRHSAVPVLVHKFEVMRGMDRTECQRVCAHTFSRVLHPTDFSECAEAAFNVVKHLHSTGVEEVILLHIQDERAMHHRPPEQLAEFERIDTERLQKMQRALSLYRLRSRVMIRQGIPFVEVLRVAEEEDVSLIVLGSRGRSALRELLSGSTFENVIRQSRRPVLVITGDNG